MGLLHPQRPLIHYNLSLLLFHKRLSLIFSMLSNKKCFEEIYHMEIISQRDTSRDKVEGTLKTMEIHVLK